MGNWIQLTSGGGYDFEIKDIFGRYTMERDLAYPLAGVNRFVRHTQIAWPVAIHSVLVALLIEKMTCDLDAAAAGLLHDAHESIIGDIPTPVSWAIDYKKIEALKEEVQEAIEDRLGVPDKMRPYNHMGNVKLADSAALFAEKQLLMVPDGRDWNCKSPPPLWTQTMYDLIVEAIKGGWNKDGGETEFCRQYDRLITQRRYLSE